MLFRSLSASKAVRVHQATAVIQWRATYTDWTNDPHCPHTRTTPDSSTTEQYVMMWGELSYLPASLNWIKVCSLIDMTTRSLGLSEQRHTSRHFYEPYLDDNLSMYLTASLTNNRLVLPVLVSYKTCYESTTRILFARTSSAVCARPAPDGTCQGWTVRHWDETMTARSFDEIADN